MSLFDRGRWLRHRRINRLQTFWLILALLAQMGLPRVREFDADQFAVLTGDPEGLVSVLGKIERLPRPFVFFPRYERTATHVTLASVGALAVNHLKESVHVFQ